MSDTEDKQEDSAMERETRLEVVTKDTSNDDVQKRGLEEEIEQDVERRYQDLITRELGCDNVKEVLEALIKVQRNYSYVGTYWKVPKYQIESYEKGNSFQPKECLMEIVTYWLSHNTKNIEGAPPINFQSVLEALQHPLVGGGDVAKGIVRDFKKKIQKEVRKEKDLPDESPVL